MNRPTDITSAGICGSLTKDRLAVSKAELHAPHLLQRPRRRRRHERAARICHGHARCSRRLKLVGGSCHSERLAYKRVIRPDGLETLMIDHFASARTPDPLAFASALLPLGDEVAP